MTPDQKLIDCIIEQGDGLYKDVHQLEDGTIVGTCELMFTRALCIDMNAYSPFARRYCYEDKGLATAACLALKTGDDEPLPGYVSSRQGLTQRKRT